MTSRTQNTVGGLLMIGLMALTASAADVRLNEADVLRAVAKVVREQKTQLEKYREGLRSLTPAANQTAPTPAELLPVLRELATYNSQLGVAGWNDQAHRLAVEINKPLPVYWNTYRGNSFVEIVDTYIPDNHGDADLADLEFFVKQHLISFEDWVQNKGLAELLPEDFYSAHQLMEIDLDGMNTRDGKSIIKSMIRLAAAYNRLYQNEETRSLALQLHKTYFQQPIFTGWQRTVTVKELRSQYGMASYTTPFSTDELKARYGVSQEEAETLHAFFSHYHD